MSGYFVLLLSLAIDLPTIITIAACSKVKTFIKALLWVFLASLVGEIITGITSPTYQPSYIFFLRIAVQTFIGVMTFIIANTIRQSKEQPSNPEQKPKPIRLEIVKGYTIEDITKRINWIDGFFQDMQRLLSFKLQWSERTILEKAYTALFVILLVGLLPMPYAFYDVLRFIVCVCLYFFLQTVLPQRRQKRGCFYLILGMLVLYNPVAPIHFGERESWAILNFLTLYLLYGVRQALDAPALISKESDKVL